ncbi:MAG: hypothetical protein ACYS26_04325 [Planctomycetota bacterium]|jgi:hypothetical protein
MALWKFTRRSPTCVACGHEFADGEVHYSRLQVHPEELLREDLCRACWQAQQADGAASPDTEDPPSGDSESSASEGDGNTLLWWRATRRIVETKRMQVDMEGLERVFLLLEGREEEHLEELRYLLCLLLVRKRRLMLGRALVQGDREYLVVRRPRRQEELKVRVFDFQPERMEALRDDLERLFEGEGLSEGSGEDGAEQANAEDAEDAAVEGTPLEGAPVEGAAGAPSDEPTVDEDAEASTSSAS